MEPWGCVRTTGVLAEPKDVRCVIALESPFANASCSPSNLSEIHRRIARESAATADPSDLEALAGDLPVPTVRFPSRWSILLRSADPPTWLQPSDRG